MEFEAGRGGVAVDYELGRLLLQDAVMADGGVPGIYRILCDVRDDETETQYLARYSGLLRATVDPDQQQFNASWGMTDADEGLSPEEVTQREMDYYQSHGYTEKQAGAILVALALYRMAFPEAAVRWSDVESD